MNTTHPIPAGEPARGGAGRLPCRFLPLPDRLGRDHPQRKGKGTRTCGQAGPAFQTHVTVESSQYGPLLVFGSLLHEQHRACWFRLHQPVLVVAGSPH
jgi:hypothetical protein